MDEVPRIKLGELIDEYGFALCQDAKRCEGLLRDVCGESRREINILISAVKEGIAAELLASLSNSQPEILLSRLTRKLEDNFCLREDAAQWGVMSWAFALGIISLDEASSLSASSATTKPAPARNLNAQPPSNSNHSWQSQPSTPNNEIGFRKAAWGMNRDQVIQTEGREDVEEGANYLSYAGQVAGLSCSILYIFVEGTLVRGKYFFNVSHSNDNDHLSDYSTLKEMLIKKYGRPLEDEKLWKDDLYKDDYQEWGLAVSSGRLTMYAKWEKSETEIALILSGDNYQIDLSIEYISKRLGHLEDQMRERQALDEL
jgi:hypothetical protein